MPSARRVRLIYQEQTQPTATGRRFTVQAADGHLMDNYLFRFRRRTGDSDDYFQGVCTVAELSSLPVGDPDDDSDELYRTDSVDITCDTASEAEEAWEDIQTAVTALKAQLDAADTLSAATSVWIGTPP